MPIPLPKLKKLSEEEPEVEPVNIITQRRRSTSSLWVAMVNGRPASPVFKNTDEVVKYMGENRSYDIQKLHPQGDSELITKINTKYNVWKHANFARNVDRC